MTNTAAAHLIAADATALGDPEIIIMTRDEGMGAEEIERDIFVGAWHEGSARCQLHSLGWRPVGDLTEVEPGYYIVDVERV